MRDKNIRDGGVNRVDQGVVVNFADPAVAETARKQLTASIAELQWRTQPASNGDGVQLVGTFTAAEQKAVQDAALKQNITTLHNPRERTRRAEPVHPAAGLGPHRGRTARRAGHGEGEGHHRPHGDARSASRRPGHTHPTRPTRYPPGDELFTQGNQTPVLLRKQIIFTGEPHHRCVRGLR